MRTIIFIFLCTSTFAADFTGYGFIKAALHYSNEAVNSFSNVNGSAVTSATSAAFPGPSGDRTTMQVGQSRLGVLAQQEKDYGLLEFDFIDFEKSSPTTQSNPRVRRALVVHFLSDYSSLELGLDWDVFAPVRPTTFDIVGLYFHAGNTGFMRNQFKYVYAKDENTFTLALGQAGRNAGPADSTLETENELSTAFNYQRKIGEVTASTSAITAQKKINAEKEKVWGTSLGLSSRRVNAEIFYGEGLSYLGVLSLDQIGNGKQYGGFVTVEQPFDDLRAIVMGLGHMWNEEEGDDIWDAIKNKYADNDIAENKIARLAFSHTKGPIQYFIEASNIVSTYDEEIQTASTIELGAIYRF